MANAFAKLLNLLLVVYYLGLGAVGLYDLPAFLEAAGAPLSDKTKYAPYSTASFFHASKLMSFVMIGLAMMLLVHGGSRVSFLLTCLVSAACAYEEFLFKEKLAGLGAPPKHVGGLENAMIAFGAAAGIAALGVLVGGGSTKKAKAE